MCAIYVLTGKSITPAEAELAFYRTVSRGPDMSNFSETEEGYHAAFLPRREFCRVQR